MQWEFLQNIYSLNILATIKKPIRYTITPGTPNHNPAIIIPIEKPRGRFCLPRIVVTLLFYVKIK